MSDDRPTTPDAPEDTAADNASLRRQLEEVRRIADAIPHIVWTHDATGTPTYFNAKWTEYSGLDLAQTLAVGAGSLVHPDDLPTLVEKQATAREGYEATYRLRRHDGVYRWHRARVVVLRADDARPSWLATATDIDEERRTQDELEFLVAAGEVLGTSLDLGRTLQDVARLVVPHLADWCAIDLLGSNGRLDRAAVAHVDPAKVELGWDLWKRVPPKPEDEHGVYKVIRTEAPDLIEDVPDELLVATIPDPEILRIVRSLGLRSSICVPLRIRGRTLGALSLVAAETGRRFGKRDLAFANVFATRIALAIDNAALYGAAEQSRQAAEALAADVAEQSRAVHDALMVMRAERDAALERAGGAPRGS